MIEIENKDKQISLLTTTLKNQMKTKSDNLDEKLLEIANSIQKRIDTEGEKIYQINIKLSNMKQKINDLYSAQGQKINQDNNILIIAHIFERISMSSFD